MKTEQFEKVIEEQIERIREVLIVKAKEYATEDRLHNFRVSAQLQNITMEQALAGMLSKHTVSIYDMIASGDRYGVEKWDEKINEHIVYLLLLRAIIEEKRTNEYVVETDKGPIVVTNSTYSLFEEDLKYRQFLKANPGLDPEFLNKKFNTSCEEQKSRLMAEVHEEYMRGLRTKINPIDDRMDNPQLDGETSAITYHRLFPDRLYVEYPVTLSKIEFAVKNLGVGCPASQKICRAVEDDSIIIVNVVPYYRIVYTRDNCDNGQAVWIKQPLKQSNGILKLAEDIGATLRERARDRE